MKGVDTKRIYLCERLVGNAPYWLKPFLRFHAVLKAWRKYCLRKVNNMSEGEVLARYYEYTEGANA